MSQFKLVKDLELEESIEISSDYTELNNAISCLSGQLSELCAISLLKPNGGSISGDIEIHKADFTVLSGSYIQTTDPKNTIFTENSFLQAETDYSSSGNTYGHAYCGTMGYCILGVQISEDKTKFGFKLSGDISALSAAFYDNTYLGKNIKSEYNSIKNDPLYALNSKAIAGRDDYIPICNGKSLACRYLDNNKELSSLTYSFTLDSGHYPAFSKIERIERIDDNTKIVWFKNSLEDMNSIFSGISGTIIGLSGRTEEKFIEHYENDDNAFYAVGFPYIGNLNIKNIQGSMSTGGSTRAIGRYSHAEGRDTVADGRYSHAEGAHSKALGHSSHAGGFGCIAVGDYSTAIGQHTTAQGRASFSQGQYSNAMGIQSVALGDRAVAKHDQSFVWSGVGTKESKAAQSFNIYPGNGINGFYIGNDNFITCVLKAIQQMTPEQKTLLKNAIGI